MFIEEKIYTVSEAASILRCSSQKIYRLIHTKALNAYKKILADVLGMYRITVSKVMFTLV